MCAMAVIIKRIIGAERSSGAYCINAVANDSSRADGAIENIRGQVRMVVIHPAIYDGNYYI